MSSPSKLKETYCETTYLVSSSKYLATSSHGQVSPTSIIRTKLTNTIGWHPPNIHIHHLGAILLAASGFCATNSAHFVSEAAHPNLRVGESLRWGGVFGDLEITCDDPGFQDIYITMWLVQMIHVSQRNFPLFATLSNETFRHADLQILSPHVNVSRKDLDEVRVAPKCFYLPQPPPSWKLEHKRVFF